ncbi:hypothetical protein [Streptomyces sp. NPDC054783]
MDIAVRRRHEHRTALLRPDLGHPLPSEAIARLREHLHRLIRARAVWGTALIRTRGPATASEAVDVPRTAARPSAGRTRPSTAVPRGP